MPLYERISWMNVDNKSAFEGMNKAPFKLCMLINMGEGKGETLSFFSQRIMMLLFNACLPF